jgi:DNA invertase Pin-like site-specific DNA recombinase
MPRTRIGNPAVAVAYIRVSTDDQKLGPEAQRAQIESFAAREGLTVAAWHCDQGVSGGSDLADRPALVAALADLRAFGAGVLLAAKRDRLARDVVIAATVERAAKAYGAKVLCADGTGNGDTAADAFMRTLLDGAAQYERALCRERTRAALAAKKARGERVGTVPYGFTAGPEGSLVPHEAEQEVIACIRELRAAGLSLRAIEAELAKRGIVSRTGQHPLALPAIAKIAKVAA